MSLVVDPKSSYMYVGASAAPTPRLLKVDLDRFKPVDVIQMQDGEGFPEFGIIDAAGEYGYFVVHVLGGAKIVKFRLGDEERLFTDAFGVVDTGCIGDC